MSTVSEGIPAAPEDDAKVATRKTINNEVRARRAAIRVGWIARKSRWRAGTNDNYGGFAIIDPFRNNILYGEKFDLSAEDVIGICTPDTEE